MYGKHERIMQAVFNFFVGIGVWDGNASKAPQLLGSPSNTLVMKG